jgi:hypothetical protein
MKPGMIFTIEPALSEGSPNIRYGTKLSLLPSWALGIDDHQTKAQTSAFAH